jgi:hypothetical protein
LVIPSGFSGSGNFKFFSFADFSHALSLLHPNWPENIFGKVYFLDPKFLILPLIAFSSLLFVKNKNILYFALISLFGIFLAKGANPPFGEINSWFFSHVPGMSMFRDPTKWYVLIVLGYSILIPYSLKEISKYFKFIPILFAIYFLFLINPIFAYLKLHQVPQEYVQLKNFLNNQNTFSRTLWIPQWQRYGYFSNTHPAIGRYEIFDTYNNKKMVGELKNDQELLSELSVKYVIVPFDSEGEMFTNYRKYSDLEYQKVVNGISSIGWLKPVANFGKIKVFEPPFAKDHFFSSSKNLKVSYKFINPSSYEVKVENAKKGDILVFSEGYDKNWVAEAFGLRVQSKKFNAMLNSFKLPQDGTYALKVYFQPQKWVNIGLVLSLLSLISAIGLIIFGYRSKK